MSSVRAIAITDMSRDPETSSSQTMALPSTLLKTLDSGGNANDLTRKDVGLQARHFHINLDGYTYSDDDVPGYYFPCMPMYWYLFGAIGMNRSFKLEFVLSARRVARCSFHVNVYHPSGYMNSIPIKCFISYIF